TSLPTISSAIPVRNNGDRAGDEGNRDRESSRAGRMGLYGAPWLQPVAISGKSPERRTAKNNPKSLPRPATSCRRRYMVRRGSPVRVRKRALQKRRTSALL